MTCGIYAMVCDKTWRSYVGQTVNLNTRFQEHLQLLRRGIHDNSDLQKDFDLFVESSFFYETLECIDNKRLLGQRESYWICFGENLYNKTNPSHPVNLTESDIERFWRWVDVKDKDDCWNWIGVKDKDGYGRIGFRKDGKRKTMRSNRVAYFICNPNHDIHLIVRHKCNNPSCCNPNHLCVGSSSENAIDKLHKDKHHYKLTWDIVNELRNKFLENHNILPKDLNKWFYEKFNIVVPNGHLIKICNNGKWVDENYNPPKRTLRYYLSDSDMSYIKELLLLNKRPVEIYKDMNKNHSIPISKTNISKICRKIKNGEL